MNEIEVAVSCDLRRPASSQRVIGKQNYKINSLKSLVYNNYNELFNFSQLIKV